MLRVNDKDFEEGVTAGTSEEELKLSGFSSHNGVPGRSSLSSSTTCVLLSVVDAGGWLVVFVIEDDVLCIYDDTVPTLLPESAEDRRIFKLFGCLLGSTTPKKTRVEFKLYLVEQTGNTCTIFQYCTFKK